MDLVSAIIPFYKKKKFIKETINSILKQTYENIEILIVYDDTEKDDLDKIELDISKDDLDDLVIRDDVTEPLSAAERQVDSIRAVNDEGTASHLDQEQEAMPTVTEDETPNKTARDKKREKWVETLHGELAVIDAALETASGEELLELQEQAKTVKLALNKAKQRAGITDVEDSVTESVTADIAHADEGEEATDHALRPLVEQMFRDLDADNSGLLDTDEVRELTKSLGMLLDERQLLELMQKIDADGSGLVDFDEFFAWYVTSIMSGEHF